MKVILWGVGVWCERYCMEARDDHDIEIVAVASKKTSLHGSVFCGHIVISPDRIVEYEYDKIICTVVPRMPKGDARIEALLSLMDGIGIPRSKIFLLGEYNATNKRVQFLRRLKAENDFGKEGSIAECGVFRGDFAQHINETFPDRKLYLFDSFEGFTSSSVEAELPQTREFFTQHFPKFKTVSTECVMLRMPFREQVVIRKGFVPETFAGLEHERFVFVMLDMDLYVPQLAALRFFLPRMLSGGVIMLHDYFNPSLPGSKKAVDEIALEYSFTRIHVADNSVALFPNSKFERR